MKRLGKGTGAGEIRKAKEEREFFFLKRIELRVKLEKKNHNSIGITVQFEQNLTERVNLNKSKVRWLNWYDQNLED